MYLIQRKKVINDTFTSFYKQRETTPPSNDKLGALPYAYVLLYRAMEDHLGRSCFNLRS